MNKKVLIASFFSLVLGAVSGMFGGYFFAKNKFLKQADKEVESVKNSMKEYYEKKYYSSKSEEDENVKVPETKPTVVKSEKADGEKEDVKKYKDYTKPYISSHPDETPVERPTSSIVSPTPKPESKPKIKQAKKRPYLITPEEYIASEYDPETLFWFNDRILSTDKGEIIEDVDALLGPGNIDKFGTYRSDAIMIRDDENKIDYEVIFQDMKYSDKFVNGPAKN